MTEANTDKKDDVVKPADKKPEVSRKEFDALSAKVRRNTTKMGKISLNWKLFLKRMFGTVKWITDGKVDGFTKIASCIFIGLIAFGVAGALYGTGEIANWSATQNGTVRINRVGIGTNSVEADMFIGDLTGDVTGDTLRVPLTTFAGDNATVLTVAANSYLITPSGQTSGFTNDITLTAPSAAGKWVVLAVSAGATNKLGIADSGTAVLSAAFVGDAGDTITLQSFDAVSWRELSRSAN